MVLLRFEWILDFILLNMNMHERVNHEIEVAARCMK